MLESAKRLIMPSARSDVPPFMVMDVMAAAARIEAAGGRVIHMEVGQPAAPAPATRDRGGARGARHRAAAATPRRSASRRCARASRGTIGRRYGVDGRSRRGSWSPPARRPASSWRSWRCSSPATGSRSRCPAIRPTATSSRALGCEPVLIETTAATRWAITPDTLLAAHRAHAAQGRAGREPGQSDRHHDDAARRCAI